MPHCLIINKSMRKNSSVRVRRSCIMGICIACIGGKKCKWILTSYWSDRNKWLLWGKWGNKVFYSPFLPFVQSCHVRCPSWLGDRRRYHACIYSWVCVFDTEFCQAEKRSVFLQKGGGFLIEKFKKAKGSNVTIFQYLRDGYRESGSSLFIERDEGQWVEVTPEDSAWKWG